MSKRKPVKKSNQLAMLEDNAADAFKQLVSGLVSEAKKKKSKTNSLKLIERESLNDSALALESSSDDDEPEVEQKEDIVFDDENDAIDSDEDDDLSTIGDGSVTTFTPARSSDPYIAHFGLDLGEQKEELKFQQFQIEKAEFFSPGFYHQTPLSRLQLGTGAVFNVNEVVNLELFPDLKRMKVRQALIDRFKALNAKNLEKLDSPDKIKLGMMTPSQFEFFLALNNYLDVQCPKWTTENADELRIVYCLHILNHLLKSRKMIVLNNAALKHQRLKTKSGSEREFRDRGLTRAKVLVLVPFRESCSRIVETLSNLLCNDDKLLVSNRKRFSYEYQTNEPRREARYFRKMPEDFQRLFSGNVDDNFRLGVSVSKKTLKLFTDFYASDLIIASPLGLRSITPRENPTLPNGKVSSEEALFDFLSSLEVLVLDQADVLYMQNWDHVVQLMQHVNELPKQPHDVDFSRVRMWSLNNLAKNYRQTVVLSSVVLAEINAFVAQHSLNRNGRISVSKVHSRGAVDDVMTQASQIFHRIDECSDAAVASERKFDYFISKILPPIVDSQLSHTVVFVPSYFDYVRLRNHCKREQLNCLWLSEYCDDRQVSRVRTLFRQGKIVFMLYTERLHFFKRFRISSVHNVVFYGLPTYGHFYSEVANWMVDAPLAEATCQVLALYSRFEVFALAQIVGSSMARRMLSPGEGGHHRSVHMFVANSSR